MDLRVLFLGDVVGTPGVRIIQERLAEVREALRLDLVIANVENAANGSGITRALGKDLLAAGVDLMTLGDHAYGKKDQLAYIGKEERLVRPANYPERAIGRALAFLDLDCGKTVALFQVQGRVFLPATECPFLSADRVIDKALARTPLVFVDLHAEATSEKVALGWYLDGRASALFGTHTHVPTADARILPKGTAYVTDVGMTGPYDGVIGRAREPVLQKFLTNVPAYFSVADGDVRMAGALVTVEAMGGRARSIARFELPRAGALASALGPAVAATAAAAASPPAGPGAGAAKR
jgi:hypothetical protein